MPGPVAATFTYRVLSMDPPSSLSESGFGSKAAWGADPCGRCMKQACTCFALGSAQRTWNREAHVRGKSCPGWPGSEQKRDWLCWGAPHAGYLWNFSRVSLDLFWRMVSEISPGSCSPPNAWAEHHGDGLLCEDSVFTLGQPGSRLCHS